MRHSRRRREAADRYDRPTRVEGDIVDAQAMADDFCGLDAVLNLFA
jgi:hypothetical protein